MHASVRSRTVLIAVLVALSLLGPLVSGDPQPAEAAKRATPASSDGMAGLSGAAREPALVGTSEHLRAEGTQMDVDVAAVRAAMGDDPLARVIIELAVQAWPEAGIRSTQVADQRSSIAAAQARVAVALVGTSARIGRRFTTIPYMSAAVDRVGLERLASSPTVRRLTVDELAAATLDSATRVMNATPVWEADFDGTGQAIAILDTGVQSDHPALSPRVVRESCWTDAGGNGSGPPSCPNGTASQTGAGAGGPCTYADGCRHGTHVAGDAAAATTTLTAPARTQRSWRCRSSAGSTGRSASTCPMRIPAR